MQGFVPLAHWGMGHGHACCAWAWGAEKHDGVLNIPGVKFNVLQHFHEVCDLFASVLDVFSAWPWEKVVLSASSKSFVLNVCTCVQDKQSV